jgi:hypothetical protein
LSTKQNLQACEFLMNFEILPKHFGTVTQCLVDPAVPVMITTKSLETSQKPNFWTQNDVDRF